jgi:predicted  nucleic acid-binding Zn-ribbon protein
MALALKANAKAVSLLGERILAMETEMRALRAEVKFDALKETQQMINAVQGGFNDKLTDVTVRISHLEAQRTSQSPLITFKAGTVRSEDSDKPAA